MVWSISGFKLMAISWWDNTCEACLEIRNIFSWIIKVLYGFALMAGLLWIIYWAFDNESPYIVHGIDIEKTVYYPGETANVIIDIEKLRNCQGIVKRSLGGNCGNRKVILTPTTMSIGRRIFNLAIDIPNDINDGAICIAHISINYKCNPLHSLLPKEQFFPEVIFTVRKNTPFIEGGPGFMTP